MDIKSIKGKKIDIQYKKDSFQQFAEDLKEIVKNDSYHLSLFLGHYQPDKKVALQQIVNSTGLSLQKFDLNDFVSKSENETRKNLANIFDRFDTPESVLYFYNGDKLCGAYTGFSHSRVKYASPQERYFLELIQACRGLVIVEISKYTAADKTIRRAAHSIVRFDLPDSLLKRFMWHLKNYSFHGFELKTKRPDSYGEVPGNF